jgi:BCCT, betaine/carnitine/choline family transporter
MLEYEQELSWCAHSDGLPVASRITLSSVVGLFTAYISKGRKLWEVVWYSIGAPMLTLLVWCTVWAGVSLRQSRQALEMIGLGESMYNNSEHFLVDGSNVCYNVPQADILVNDEIVFTNRLPGVTPVCLYDPDNPSTATYNILSSFHISSTSQGSGMSTMLSILYLVSIGLSYVAHSDSTSFIIDTLASNGRKNYHWSRRMFWGATIAAVATALVASDGDDAVIAATVISSLPMLILLCYVMQSVALFSQAADKLRETDDDTEYLFPEQGVFGMPIYGGIFNVFEYLVSLGKVNPARLELGMGSPTKKQVVEFGIGFFLPFLSLRNVLSTTYPQNPKTNATVVLGYTSCYLAWVILALASRSHPGFTGLAGTLFLFTGMILARVRSGFRSHFKIRSNSVADYVTSALFWPQVLAQMSLHCDGVVHGDGSASVAHLGKALKVKSRVKEQVDV